MLTLENAQELVAGMVPANFALFTFMDDSFRPYGDLPMALNERGPIALTDRPDLTYLANTPGGGSASFSHAFQLYANGPAGAPTLTKEMQAAGAVYDYTPDNWGIPVTCANFTFQGVLNGVFYKIPDLWLGIYAPYAGIFSNWKGRSMTGIGTGGYGIEVYGWRDGNAKDPVVLSIVANAKTVSGVSCAFITIKYVRDIKNEMPEDAFDQFNYRLARKKLEDKTFNPRTLLKTHAAEFPDSITVTPVLDSWNKAKFEAIRMDVDPEATITSGSPEYAQVAVLTNDTDAPMTFKTADFAWQVQDQFTFKWTNSEKAATTASYKSQIKCVLGLPSGEGPKFDWTYETAISATFEYSHSEENSSTHTETKTFTVSGQTVVVPPHTTYIAEAQWRRAKLQGVATIFYPVTQDVTAVVKFTNETSWLHGATYLNSALDMDKVAKVLGVDLIKVADVKNAKGENRQVPCVVGHYPFECTTSSLATYGVRPSK